MSHWYAPRRTGNDYSVERPLVRTMALSTWWNSTIQSIFATACFPRLKLNPKLLVSGSFDDISRILPPDASDHFVGGFREALLHI